MQLERFKVFFGSCVLLMSQLNVTAYNLDSANAAVFNDPKSQRDRRGSYFGFSVALFSSEGDSVLLVGAPRANVSEISSAVEPGTVYKCSITNDTCDEWIIDRSGNGRHDRHRTVNQIKDNAWIGATIAVENKTHPRVVVCGPRWKNRVTTGYLPKLYMNGICYLTSARNAGSFDKEADMDIIPLSSPHQQVYSANGIGVFNFGMGQTGFSLHMTSNDLRRDIATGNPGVYNWKGSPLLITEIIGRLTETIIPSIKDESFFHGGDYVGYAITSGRYFKSGEYWFASGAPRASAVSGNVFIFSYPKVTNTRLLIKEVLSGKQHGEYFGSALASCDVNNDGKDELVVGAPQWAKDVDEGRIYIFSNRHNNFEQNFIDGEVAGGRFGTTISCLGDIDYDSYCDIAVGSPYEGYNGAIYVFNGNKNGLSKKYSQKITGSEFSPNIRGFGISISEPMDINNDNHADIAVGAYLSEHVILIRSKPVVTVSVELEYIEKKKLLKNSTFFLVSLCTSYDGAYVPDTMKIVRNLKVDQMHGRATYSSEPRANNSYQIIDTFQRGKRSCGNLKINLRKNVQNIIDPIEVSVSISLENGETEKNTSCISPCPVINKAMSKTEDTVHLPFAVDCGDDNICSSDLRITVSTDLESGNRYVIGSTSTLKLVITASNQGEPAYRSKVNLYIPEVVSLASVPPECTENSVNKSEVICDVGNPLRTSKVLTIELDVSDVKYPIDRAELRGNLTTQSDELNPLDNTFIFTIYFDMDIDIAIAGKAQEDLYSYLDNDEKRRLDKIKFQHVYEVQKFGASPIEEVLLTIRIPTYWKHTAGDIEIVRIDQTAGHMNGRKVYCTSFNDSETSTSSAVTDFADGEVNFDIPSRSLRNSTFEKFTVEENTTISIPPDNRTLYVNCSNPMIKCRKITCKLGSFVTSLSVAKIGITLDLQLLNFPSETMEGKDIIFVTTGGYVNITWPSNAVQKIGHKPDSATVATTFLGTPTAQKLAIWIIALSVLLGILLLVLVILGLIKIGFFNRKKKEELEALKAERDRRHSVEIATTSSREVLDHD